MRYGQTATDNMGYIPENEGDFLQQMFVCNQIMITMIHIILCFSIILTILGLFSQLQTVAISFITCVWLHGKTLATIGWIFMKFDIWTVFENLSQKFKFH